MWKQNLDRKEGGGKKTMRVRNEYNAVTKIK